MRWIVRRAVDRAVSRLGGSARARAGGVDRRGVHDRELMTRWGRAAESLLRFGGASSGNAVTVFCNGDEAFAAMWQAIDAAQRKVWLETYIMEPDRVGRRTVQALADAARRGCEVILLYDGLGGGPMTEESLQSLRDAGARIEVFNPLRLLPGTGMLRRNHRKIMIVDDERAFCGGMNQSEDYAGPEHGNCRFLDCHLSLRGPCVADLAGVFVNSLRIATGQRDPRSRRRIKARRRGVSRSRSGEPSFVQVLASSGRGGRRAIQRAIRHVINRAVHECIITTPYFVPPHRVIRAMTRAAQRGVDVQILTAGVSDVPIVRTAAQHVYGDLLAKGIRIYEMYGSTLHAKTMAIDGLYSTVGSFNLDTWSDRRNLEVTVGIIDADVTRTVKKQFLDNLRCSREVTLKTLTQRSMWQRFVQWLAYQLMRL